MAYAANIIKAFDDSSWSLSSYIDIVNNALVFSRAATALYTYVGSFQIGNSAKVYCACSNGPFYIQVYYTDTSDSKKYSYTAKLAANKEIIISLHSATITNLYVKVSSSGAGTVSILTLQLDQQNTINIDTSQPTETNTAITRVLRSFSEPTHQLGVLRWTGTYETVSTLDVRIDDTYFDTSLNALLISVLGSVSLYCSETCNLDLLLLFGDRPLAQQHLTNIQKCLYHNYTISAQIEAVRLLAADFNQNIPLKLVVKRNDNTSASIYIDVAKTYIEATGPIKLHELRGYYVPYTAVSYTKYVQNNISVDIRYSNFSNVSQSIQIVTPFIDTRGSEMPSAAYDNYLMHFTHATINNGAVVDLLYDYNLQNSYYSITKGAKKVRLGRVTEVHNLWSSSERSVATNNSNVMIFWLSSDGTLYAKPSVSSASQYIIDTNVIDFDTTQCGITGGINFTDASNNFVNQDGWFDLGVKGFTLFYIKSNSMYMLAYPKYNGQSVNRTSYPTALSSFDKYQVSLPSSIGTYTALAMNALYLPFTVHETYLDARAAGETYIYPHYSGMSFGIALRTTSGTYTGYICLFIPIRNQNDNDGVWPKLDNTRTPTICRAYNRVFFARHNYHKDFLNTPSLLKIADASFTGPLQPPVSTVNLTANVLAMSSAYATSSPKHMPTLGNVYFFTPTGTFLSYDYDPYNIDTTTVYTDYFSRYPLYTEVPTFYNTASVMSEMYRPILFNLPTGDIACITLTPTSQPAWRTTPTSEIYGQSRETYNVRLSLGTMPKVNTFYKRTKWYSGTGYIAMGYYIDSFSSVYLPYANISESNNYISYWTTGGSWTEEYMKGYSKDESRSDSFIWAYGSTYHTLLCNATFDSKGFPVYSTYANNLIYGMLTSATSSSWDSGDAFTGIYGPYNRTTEHALVWISPSLPINSYNRAKFRNDLVYNGWVPFAELQP